MNFAIKCLTILLPSKAENLNFFLKIICIAFFLFSCSCYLHCFNFPPLCFFLSCCGFFFFFATVSSEEPLPPLPPPPQAAVLTKSKSGLSQQLVTHCSCHRLYFVTLMSFTQVCSLNPMNTLTMYVQLINSYLCVVFFLCVCVSRTLLRSCK